MNWMPLTAPGSLKVLLPSFVEPVALAVHGGHEHVPAVEAALGAAQAIAGLAPAAGDLLGVVHEVGHRLRRPVDPGLLEQLLVVEQGADIEAVRQHVGLVVDGAAEVQGTVGQGCGLGPFGEIGLEALELAVAGIERHPALRHLDHVGRLAALDHRHELLEGLPQGSDTMSTVTSGLAFSNGGQLRLQERRALRAGDHLDELELRGGKRRCCREHGAGQRQNQGPSHRFLPL